MISNGFFLLRWLFFIVLIVTFYTAFRLVLLQADQDTQRSFQAFRNPKFKFANALKKNETVALPANLLSKEEMDLLASPLPDDGSEHSVQIFYYPWYGNPKFDNGKYYHWNHPYIPPWNPSDNDDYPTGEHVPPSDIGANFFPLLGPYSSRDDAVIEQHMKWMSSAGVDVVVVSWFPRWLADEHGHPWDDLIPTLLNATAKYRMKLTFHMEPYKDKDVRSIRADIEYIIDNYGSHPALFRVKRPITSKMNDANNGNNDLQGNESFDVPLLYFYDSYLIPDDEWKKLTTPTGIHTVRKSAYDVLFVGLLVKSEDRYSLLKAGFDGIYTYFAADGFSYGSTPSNWPSLSAFCKKNGLLFIPSVGPGYDDRRVRPWNEVNYRDRKNGEYYAKMFEMAHTARANIVTITSFNEWHEGTQIEPAIPFVDNSTGFKYSTYTQGPEQYLRQTLDLIKKYFTPLDKIASEKIVNIV